MYAENESTASEYFRILRRSERRTTDMELGHSLAREPEDADLVDGESCAEDEVDWRILKLVSLQTKTSGGGGSWCD